MRNLLTKRNFMSNIIEINDFFAPELDVYVRLTGAELRNKLEPERGIFIAESPTVIEVALKSGCEPISLLTDKRLLTGSLDNILSLVGDVPIYVAEREVLKDYTGFELTRGALCAMKRPMLPSVEDVCRDAKRIAVLEGVCDATNIGAIFRSAAALGIDAVILTPTCCDPMVRRAVRVSMGTVFQIPFARIGTSHKDWPLPSMGILKDLGFTTCAMALSDNSVSIADPVLKKQEKLAIILGTEGDGLSKSTIAECDYTVKIPMYHGVDSLNVAAASAVAFWQLAGNR